MKKIKLILIVLIFGTSLVANNLSFPIFNIPPKIFDAFKLGNASEIAKYFNSNIELVIIDKDDVYSKQQAEQILKSFFDKNKVKSFTVLHQGGKESAQYAIGTLETINNKSFRVYFLLKDTGGSLLIHQLRIEEE